MNNKTLALASYITFIGWLISYFSSKNGTPRPSLVCYHLKQSLGLFIFFFFFNVTVAILAAIVPTLSFLTYISIVFLVLMILGAINAYNEKETPLPFIGKMFEDKFSFIK